MIRNSIPKKQLLKRPLLNISRIKIPIMSTERKYTLKSKDVLRSPLKLVKRIIPRQSRNSHHKPITKEDFTIDVSQFIPPPNKPMINLEFDKEKTPQYYKRLF